MFERFQNVHVKITDFSFLRTIPLEKVDSFLRSRGWQSKPHENLMIYSDPISKRTLELSRNDDFDYAGRLQAALSEMQDIYKYNELTLVEKILNAN
ncbi:hypothetical protein [Alicyclobacillus dauci]|uniref:Uncharacterized protein n=1 Tax=Alicyclobacillus dauci TaxID=1475485 RepID=A0ABY6Z1E8_9BACL|nr:hypothetical protein [Alicyclobacillus dauci]WAH36549.1 hypothetical protein NZD86_20445 [Alicyclobacillus dauci]